MTILIYLKNPGTRILYIKTSPQIHIYMYLLKIPIDILVKKGYYLHGIIWKISARRHPGMQIMDQWG